MQGGVQTHQRVTTLPVDLQRDKLADLRTRHARRRNVLYISPGTALACVNDRNVLPAWTNQDAAVAGLTPSQWVEIRPVKLDSALVNGHYARRRAL